MFKHHPDGIIMLDGLSIPLDEFLLDEPTYKLPELFIGREYDPLEKRHFLFTSSRQEGGPTPWVEGDLILARHERGEYAANIASRAVAKAAQMVSPGEVT